MPYMYILECSDKTYYTGSTWHLEQRIEEHNSGMGANYTSKRLPVKLAYFEEYSRIEDAFKREKQVQNWSHNKKEALIKGNESELKAKSRKKRIYYTAPLDSAAKQETVNPGSDL